MSNQIRFTDEELTAFLDGEADTGKTRDIIAALKTDEVLQKRVDDLSFPKDKLTAAFDKQLAAAPAMPKVPRPARTSGGWGMFAGGLGSGLAAGLLLAFGLGLGLGQQEAKDPGWLEVVANYQALYVPETLVQGASADAKAEQLTELSELIDLDLSGLEQIEGLTFQRGQQLGFKGKPLVQLAYVLPDGTPVAICILRSTKAQSEHVSRNIEGLAAVHWTTGQHGVLVIGGQDQSLMDAIAPVVEANI